MSDPSASPSNNVAVGDGAAITPEAEAVRRLWEYRTQEENVFYQRINFFLVAESMLIVAYTTVFAKEGLGFSAQTVIALGFLLTVAWVVVSHRQRVAYSHIRDIVVSVCPEYASLRQTRPKSWVPSSWFVMTYVVPALLLGSWAALLVGFYVDRHAPNSSGGASMSNATDVFRPSTGSSATPADRVDPGAKPTPVERTPDKAR